MSEGGMMGKNTKRLSYKSSYKNFLLQHICFFILCVSEIGEYCFVVIFPSVYVISKSIPAQPQMIFALIIPLVWIIFAIIACIGVGQYGQEIAHLFSGNFSITSLVMCFIRTYKCPVKTYTHLSMKKQMFAKLNCFI